MGAVSSTALPHRGPRRIRAGYDHIYLNFTRHGHGGPSFDHDGASDHTELMPPGKERSKLARAVFIPPTGKRGAALFCTGRQSEEERVVSPNELHGLSTTPMKLVF